MKLRILTSLFLVALSSSLVAAENGRASIIMIAGNPSHGPGEHEHNAGIQLLAKCLAQNEKDKTDVHVHLNSEWPSAEEQAKADTIVIYCDGGGGQVALSHREDMEKMMKRGVGLVCLHYAVEVPAGEAGGTEFLRWLGGYFEMNWSVNPTWEANFKQIPKHPTTNGVHPFSSTDEWYFHMRFTDGKKGITDILADVPPASTMDREDGTHTGNPTVRAEVAAKKPQTVSWAFERQDGSKGRGFGFTGGHYHKGWANNDQRKLILNAILWSAKVEVPANGVESKVTAEELAANLDKK